MKITKRDTLVILYIVSVILVFVAYQYFFSGTVEETETVNAECDALENRVAELERKKEDQPEIENEIEIMETKIAEMVSSYPQSIPEEDIVLYVDELNEKMGMNATAVSFSSPATVYSVVGTEGASKYAMMMYQIQVNVDYTTDYDGLKNLINYINEDPDHRAISSVDINIVQSNAEDNAGNNAEQGESEEKESESEEETAEDKQLTGSFTIMLYSIDGQLSDEPDNPRYEIPEIEHGIEEIFE